MENPLGNLSKLINDYLDTCIARMIVGSPVSIYLPPVPDLPEEAAFVVALLQTPEDDTARKVFADWLDERGRHTQAKYLREIKRQKFVRRVRQMGRHGMDHLPPLPPPIPKYISRTWKVNWSNVNLWSVTKPLVEEGSPLIQKTLNDAMRLIEKATADDPGDIYKYMSEPPPKPSPRLEAWKWRFSIGWRLPKSVRCRGYSDVTGYLGIYVWEYRNVILPLLESLE